jgi:hypothetical protein
LRLGVLATTDHRYDDAAAAFDAAEELIGPDPADQEQQLVDLWLELQLNGRVTLQYWRNAPELALSILEAARPVVEARGSRATVARFYNNLTTQHSRQRRYRIDEEILSEARKALSAAREVGEEELVGWTVFTLALALLWHGDLEEAGVRLEETRVIAGQIGDMLLGLRALCYLCFCALRRHDVPAVRRMAPETIAAALEAGYPEYVAAGRAMMAWVAWRDGRPEAVLALGGEALALWSTTVVSYSWYWLCLWPMIAVHLDSGAIGEAVDLARRLLAPPQQRLAEQLEAAVQLGLDTWDGGGGAELAGRTLAEALALACDLGYA